MLPTRNKHNATTEQNGSLTLHETNPIYQITVEKYVRPTYGTASNKNMLGLRKEPHLVKIYTYGTASNKNRLGLRTELHLIKIC